MLDRFRDQCPGGGEVALRESDEREAGVRTPHVIVRGKERFLGARTRAISNAHTTANTAMGMSRRRSNVAARRSPGDGASCWAPSGEETTTIAFSRGPRLPTPADVPTGIA